LTPVGLWLQPGIIRAVKAGVSKVDLRPERLDGPAGRRLIAAFESEVMALYSEWNPSLGPSARADELEPPAGGFFVAYVEERAVACGGFKRLDERTAEIKRMYTVPEVRGRGLARVVLDRLESEARGAGYELVRLDTGEHQQHALSLYRSAGYYEIPDYNQNPPASYWFEKSLR
jgi:GNAT superfamily N-acetyltransferase